MADSSYVSVIGIVQFDPKERETNGQSVRDVALRSVASQKTVRATVWSAHASVVIRKGDVLAIDGKASQNTVQTDEGPKVYNNLSVSGIVNLGGLKFAPKPETANPTASAQDADDEIPF